MKTAIALYEVEHLASLDSLLAHAGSDFVVVSLDAEIDYALEKRGVPFVSGKTLQNRTEPAAFLRGGELTAALYGSKPLASLEYRGVSVLEPLRFSVHIYLIDLLYYIDTIKRFLESASDIERIIVPASTVPVPKTSGPLASEQSMMVYDAAQLVAEERNISCELFEGLSAPVRLKNFWQVQTLAAKRAWFGIALSFLNALMNLRPQRTIRLLASDYWRNLAPLMHELPEAELVLLDRAQAFKAGLKNIWRYKIRFLHIEHFLAWRGKSRARAYAKECRKEWLGARGAIFSSLELSFKGVDLTAFIGQIMDRLIADAVPDIVHDIEGAHCLYDRLAPGAVLLRVSVSTQRHFTILPLVARLRDIPSLELQHGIEYLGEGSATRRHAAEFLALYGPIVVEEHRSIGDEAERLFPLGSPRFDSYIEKAATAPAREEHGVLTILSNTPTMSVGERYGTYSLEEYFKALGGAVRDTSKTRLVVTSRSMGARAAFSDEARARGLVGVPHEYVGATPLPRLFEQTDIFVCSYSTVVYEALLYRLPVVFAAFAPVEKMMGDFHFSPFVEAGALRIAHSPEELSTILQELSVDPEARARMSKAGWDFMQKNFSFDGHASKRIAKLVRTWPKRSSA